MKTATSDTDGGGLSGRNLATELNRRSQAWKRGLAAIARRRVLAALLVLWIVFGLIDYFVPLGSETRLFLLLGSCAAAIALWWMRMLAIRRLGDKDMADRADTLLGNSRRNLRSALELKDGAVHGGSGSEQTFLIEQAVVEGSAGFHRLPASACRPNRELWRAGLGVGAVLLMVVILAAINWKATWTVAGRMFRPWADIPPYSPLEFVLTESNPRVVYGGDLELAATIKGGVVNGPVKLLTRQGGRVQEAECFRGADQRFTQRVENVVAPVEFAFQAGRARSSWRPVEIQLEPQFSLARVRLKLPEYTGEAVREIMAGTQDLKALRGTAATLTVTSNRPLAGGTVKFMPDAAGGQEQVMTGRTTGAHTVEFDWAMRESGRLSVALEDVAGTPSPQPLVLKQTVLLDEKPQLVIHEPGMYALATPTSKLPIRGTASDDYGLKRVDLVRAMPGFRDRLVTMGPEGRTRDFNVNDLIELSRLGVKPGEVLEFYLEGRDLNPALTGIEASEVVRVEIISDDEYGIMLREKISVEEFVARFRAMEEALNQMEKALEKARNEAAKPGSEELEQALKEAREAAAKGEELLAKLAEDYPAFDLEKAANGPMKRAAEMMKAMKGELASMNPSTPGLEEKLAELLKQEEEESADLREENARAEDMAKVAALMELSQKFVGLIRQQEQVTRALDRLQPPAPADPEMLRLATEQERELARIAEELPGKIRQAAGEIPESAGMEKLVENSLGFADALEKSGAEGLMKTAADDGGNQRIERAGANAREAGDRLKQLLGRKDGGGTCQFAGMCQGFLPGNTPSRMGNSLSQMLAAMQARSGPGKGGSGGGGGGGGGFAGEDGYVVPGMSMANLPVFGPQRTAMVPTASAGISSTGSSGQGRGGEGLLKAGDVEALEAREGREQAGGELPVQPLPEKYRDAVRRFFETEGKP